MKETTPKKLLLIIKILPFLALAGLAFWLIGPKWRYVFMILVVMLAGVIAFEGLFIMAYNAGLRLAGKDHDNKPEEY